MKIAIALIMILTSLWVLETARGDVSVDRVLLGETPVMRVSLPDAKGPPVVVAHGFAGSSQMMQGYAVSLARAGYRVYAFDFLGHGRNPVPMSGDVNAIDGTTRLLVEQTERVMDAVSDEGESIALLGHSMATDVLVRVAKRRDDVGPVVLLSAFSEEIDGSQPDNLLLVVGSWEPGLRDFALTALQMVDPAAGEDETASVGSVERRAVVAPMTEHVSILESSVGKREALLWLDRAYGRISTPHTPPTGPAILGLLAGVVVLFAALAARLPERQVAPADMSQGQVFAVVALPAVITPPLAVALDPEVLPVLVADYLALHLGIYGAVQLALLLIWRVPLGPFSWPAFALLMAGSIAFALALNRYAANFVPTEDRLLIIAVMAVGSTLFFVADARLSHRVSWLRRAMIHGVFLLSLIGAVALDFGGLFFLLMIAPVIVLFYAAFGTTGHAASTRAGPLAPGLALGLVLAWSLGVSFPLFVG